MAVRSTARDAVLRCVTPRVALATHSSFDVKKKTGARTMIVVTGGSGKVGRACVRDLMDHGYDVTSIDMMPPPGQSNPPKPGDVRYSRADVTDFGQAMAALSMIDERVAKVTGVVHLAAIARARAGDQPRHLRRQYGLDLQRLRSGAPARHQKRRLGLERDGLRDSLSEGPGLRTGRRGSGAARDRLFAVEADG